MSFVKHVNNSECFASVKPQLLSYKQSIYHKCSRHIHFNDEEETGTETRKSIHFKIELISSPPIHPVVFQINHILTHIECDNVIKLINSKLNLRSVNNSKNNGPEFCRLYRRDLPLFSNIFGRIGDILDIDDKLLNLFFASKYKENTKMIQHYDQCNCTLIIYLNDLYDDQCGKTIFPKADLALHPGKGNAILFYTKKYNLKDVDTLSYHYGDKLVYGEKYIIMLQW